jgi:integrase
LFARYLKKIRTKKLAEVTTKDITDLTDKATPSEAEHLHRACKTVFRWCVRRRMLQHSPLEGLELPHKWKPRERVLSDDELRAVWIATGKVGKPFGDIVKLLIITGQRRTEIGSLKADWCSLPPSKDGATTKFPPVPLAVGGEETKATICLPKEITKNKRSHTFPLPVLCVELLSVNQDGYIFPARGDSNKSFNGWSKAKTQLDKSLTHN